MGRMRSWVGLFNFLGLVNALIFFGLALTPSLLPRPPLFLGLIAGAGAAIGYGLGTALSAVLRWVGVPEPRASAKRTAWKVLLIGGPIAYLAPGQRRARCSYNMGVIRSCGGAPT